jgi:hypothetical protein
MATTSNLRIRRTEAQVHALLGVEREIRANDHNGSRKYLKDFSNAFRNYRSVLNEEQLSHAVGQADTILIGDYHALPAAQRFAASLLEQRVQPGDRPVVLGVETIFARDQHILDEWWRREISEAEFRERIRFDLDWGYDWSPFYELMLTAREEADAIYGLDCMPREDLRKIGARDRHAAHKIAEIRQRHPGAVIVVLFGESHLAPAHLPEQLRERLPEERLLTVLQNVDALYWHAAGEQREQVRAVGVSDNVVCVFNATPLEKYENYRLHLSRWCREAGEGPDLCPTIYNLMDSLAEFLGINRYSAHNSTQPKFLMDLLPEVYGPSSGELFRRLLTRGAFDEEQIAAIARRVEERGSVYLPQANALYVHDFRMSYAAEETARFLHHACQGLPNRRKNAPSLDRSDQFYSAVVEHALGYFGSMVLDPARPAAENENVRELSRPELSRAELSRSACEELAQAAHSNERFAAYSEELGYRLGRNLYDFYIAGKIARGSLRNVFLTHLNVPGNAKELCWKLVGKFRRCKLT